MFTQTIDIKSLSLADWVALGAALGHHQQWPYFQWRDHTNVKLSDLSLEEWESIASATGFDDRWAYYRYKESRAN